jgi:hypothetical protein
MGATAVSKAESKNNMSIKIGGGMRIGGDFIHVNDNGCSRPVPDASYRRIGETLGGARLPNDLKLLTKELTGEFSRPR